VSWLHACQSRPGSYYPMIENYAEKSSELRKMWSFAFQWHRTVRMSRDLSICGVFLFLVGGGFMRVWPGGVMVGRWTCDSVVAGFDPAFSTVRLYKLFAHMCLYRQAVHFGNSRRQAMMPCCWEGNRRSAVALAVRSKWFIDLRAQGLGREMSSPPTFLIGVALVTFLMQRSKGLYVTLAASSGKR